MRMERSDKPGGSGGRRRGRPKLRLYDESEEDVARVWCRNWRTDA